MLSNGNEFQPIKIGFLVSYDWEFLKYSLPLVYAVADSITLAVDKERKTWSGETFDLPDSFYSFISKIDVVGKIELFEECFYKRYLSPMECETRERNMLARHMGSGGWHIQLDTDEYLLNIDDVIRMLKKTAFERPIQFNGYWISLYKILPDGYLVVAPDENACETFSIATNRPIYVSARNTENRVVTVPCMALHQTWARDPIEVRKKVRNWGHALDFDSDSYLKIWDSLDKNNYKYMCNLHPVWPTLWPRLEFWPANSMELLIAETNANIEKIRSNIQDCTLSPFKKFIQKLGRGIRKNTM